MKTCLFCLNTRLFNIHQDYGNHHNNTAKDDMLEFFGHQIENYLREDDAICNLCMNIMDNVARLKKRLLPLIFREDTSDSEDRKPTTFGKRWDVFRTKSFDREIDPFFDSRSPTPRDLLKCKLVVPYENTPIDQEPAEITRYRSLSRGSLARSDADSEVANAFFVGRGRGKRRKRGHNWSRRKNGRYTNLSVNTRKSAMSNYSNTYSVQSYKSRPRPESVLSSESYESFYLGEKPSSPEPDPEPEPASTLRYQNGCLLNKRTRSVSRLLEKHVAQSLILEEREKEELRKCSENSCTFICNSLDELTKHKMLHHRHLALFSCYPCGKKFTTSDDYTSHSKIHNPFPCAICHAEFASRETLTTHWQEKHVKKAVSCQYCGKKYVNAVVCDRHIVREHKQTIASRIDYKNSEVRKPEHKEFEVISRTQVESKVISDAKKLV